MAGGAGTASALSSGAEGHSAKIAEMLCPTGSNDGKSTRALTFVLRHRRERSKARTAAAIASSRPVSDVFGTSEARDNRKNSRQDRRFANRTNLVGRSKIRLKPHGSVS